MADTGGAAEPIGETVQVPQHPVRILISGPANSGKTTLCRKLAEHLVPGDISLLYVAGPLDNLEVLGDVWEPPPDACVSVDEAKNIPATIDEEADTNFLVVLDDSDDSQKIYEALVGNPRVSLIIAQQHLDRIGSNRGYDLLFDMGDHTIEAPGGLAGVVADADLADTKFFLNLWSARFVCRSQIKPARA